MAYYEVSMVFLVNTDSPESAREQVNAHVEQYLPHLPSEDSTHGIESWAVLDTVYHGGVPI